MPPPGAPVGSDGPRDVVAAQLNAFGSGDVRASEGRSELNSGIFRVAGGGVRGLLGCPSGRSSIRTLCRGQKAHVLHRTRSQRPSERVHRPLPCLRVAAQPGGTLAPLGATNWLGTRCSPRNDRPCATVPVRPQAISRRDMRLPFRLLSSQLKADIGRIPAGSRNSDTLRTVIPGQAISRTACE